MKNKKVLLSELLILFVLVLVCFCLYTRGIYRKVIKNFGPLSIASISFHSYSEMKDVDNVRNKEVIEKVIEYLSDASFGGIITERSISRSEDKNICALFVACNDGKSYEIQLTSSEIDQCYIRTAKGVFSENVYIKLAGCEELYNYAAEYINMMQSR